MKVWIKKTAYILSMLLLVMLGGCGQRGQSKYRAHCVDKASCEGPYYSSSSISACQTEWGQLESEATRNQCTVEFEYYFDCVEAEFMCGNLTQICYTLNQNYQSCLIGTR